MAKKKVYDIIYSAVVKHLRTKQGNVTSLPNDDQIQNGMRKIFRQLKDGGYNPVSADKVIKTEADLNAVLRNIKEKKNADIAAREKAAQGIERVFDKMRRGIPLNPDDQAALQGSGFKTTLDNFKGFQPKVITGGKTLDMSKYSNKMLNELAEEGNKLQDELAQLDRTGSSKLPYKEFQKKSKRLDEINEILTEAQKMPMDFFPDDLPKIPKNAKKDMLDSYKNLFLKGEDTKYDADVLATDLAERRGFIKEGQDSTDMDQKKYSDLYSEAYSFLTELRFLNRPPRKPKAKGGLMSAVKKLFKKYKPKKSGDKIYGVGGEEIDVADLKKSLGLDKATDKKSMEDLEKKLQMIIGRDRTKHAGGGLAAALVKLKKKFGKDIIQKGKAPKDKGGRKKLRQMFKDFKKRNMAGGGLAYMLGEPRENFADGGMSRRTFLKIMAALAAFPVVGKLAKTTKVAKGVKPIVTPTAEMPAHFPKLVEKIIREGQVVKKDFVKKTGDVTTYRHPDRPDMELTIEGDGKRIQLDFETDQGMQGGYEFKRGDIIDDIESPMRGKKGPDEFNQGEVKYSMAQDGETYSKAFEEGIETGTENLDEFAGIGKQKTSKSKVTLPESLDDYADGGLAGLLGE